MTMTQGLLIYGPVSALLSYWIARGMAYFAVPLGIVDQPNPRSSHRAPTPRAGGLGFVLCIAAALYGLQRIHLISEEVFTVLFWGGLLVACIGLIDDRLVVPAKARLLVHTLACVVFFLHFNHYPALVIGTYTVSWSWLGTGLFFIALLWFINLYNFLDGIDGYATSEAIFICFACGVLAISQLAISSESFIFVMLVPPLIGFLVINWAPAQIFMGDVGSGFLGYTIGATALLTLYRQQFNLWVWLILTAVFSVDATFTLLRRLFTGQRWTQAHCSHAYQHLAKRVDSHAKAVLLLMAVNVFWLLPLALLANHHARWGAAFAFVAIFPLVCLSYYLGAGKTMRITDEN